MTNKKTVILGSIFFLSCINLLFIIWFFKVHRYLPPPFFSNVTDTFNDFYNTLYWTNHEGIYDIWGSVYPPINFLFLKFYQVLFMGEISNIWTPHKIRESESSNIFPLLITYGISLIAAIRISFNGIASMKIQFILFFVFLFSPAFLFSLERGNLIILCIPVLSWYIFSNNQISRSMALALLVNIKPYFFIIYIIQIINKESHQANKDFLFLLPVFSLIIFFASGLLLNQEFYLMPLNLLGFATKSGLLSPTEVLSFPSTISAFSYFRGLVTEFSLPPIFGYLSKLLVYFYLLRTLILIAKNKVNFDDITIFSIIFLTNYSISTGGYGILFYIPAIALMYKQGDFILLGLIVLFLFIGLWDVIPIYRYSVGDNIAYLSGELVKVESYISLGSISRPTANFAVLVLFFKNLEKRYSSGSI